MPRIHHRNALLRIIILFSLLTILAGCTKQSEQPEAMGGHTTKNFEISPEVLYTKIQNKEDIVLLDVRENEEYAQEHIENTASPTLLLSVNQLSAERLKNLGLQKDKEIILYCRSGSRSAQAYQIMTSLGYTNLKSLAGGMVHWKEDRFPVATGPYTAKTTPINQQNGPRIAFDTTSRDLGTISKADGVVTATFTVKNTGESNLEIGDISTSCGCTTAGISTKNLTPNQEATLTVSFDPNFHEEPLGRFTRTVFIETNDHTTPEAEVNIIIQEVIE